MYNYFVSFDWYDKDDHHVGSGRINVRRKNKISSIDDIAGIEKEIAKSFDKVDKAIILFFQLFQKERNRQNAG